MIKRIYRKCKTIYKMKQFRNNASIGDNLQISAGSYCSSPSKEQITIGDNCELTECRLYAIGNGVIHIGNNTTIRSNSKLSSVNRITIGNCVIISNNVRIYDHNSHPVSPKEREKMSLSGFYGDEWSPTRASNFPVTIDDNVWVGEYSLILKGVHIGKGSIVAANSVVTKDVPEYTIVAGNPAIVVKEIEVQE